MPIDKPTPGPSQVQWCFGKKMSTMLLTTCLQDLRLLAALGVLGGKAKGRLNESPLHFPAQFKKGDPMSRPCIFWDVAIVR